MRLGWLARPLTLRRLVRAMETIADQQRQQTQLLARIAQRMAPQDPQTDPQIVTRETGNSYLDPTEQALALAYVERMRASGQEPTDEDVVEYLADEKTRDLQQRLAERDRALRERMRP